jgi:hypothetical protein
VVGRLVRYIGLEITKEKPTRIPLFTFLAGNLNQFYIINLADLHPTVTVGYHLIRRRAVLAMKPSCYGNIHALVAQILRPERLFFLGAVANNLEDLHASPIKKETAGACGPGRLQAEPRCFLGLRVFFIVVLCQFYPQFFPSY